MSQRLSFRGPVTHRCKAIPFRLWPQLHQLHAKRVLEDLVRIRYERIEELELRSLDQNCREWCINPVSSTALMRKLTLLVDIISSNWLLPKLVPKAQSHKLLHLLVVGLAAQTNQNLDEPIVE